MLRFKGLSNRRSHRVVCVIKGNLFLVDSSDAKRLLLLVSLIEKAKSSVSSIS